MDLLLISEDQKLYEKLQTSGYFEVSIQNNLHHLTSTKPNVLIISDRLIDKNLLIEKASVLHDINFVFYMISDIKKENETIEILCQTNQIHSIAPQQSESEILSQIIRTVFPKSLKENHLFMFLGADHKVGTTTIVQSLGQQLSQNTDKNILMVSLNNKPNDQFIPKGNQTIDTLRNKLTSKILTFEDILDACYQDKKFYYLPGPRNLLSIRKYNVSDILHLIDILANEKDFIFLFDLGSDLDNPLTIAAIQRVTNRYLITTTAQSALDSFKQIEEQVLNKEVFKLKANDFLLILNMFDELEDEDPSKIASQYGSTFIGALPITKYGPTSEKERKVVSIFSESFSDKLLSISRIISTKAEAQFIQAMKTKTSFIKRLFSTRGE